MYIQTSQISQKKCQVKLFMVYQPYTYVLVSLSTCRALILVIRSNVEKEDF